MGGKPMTADEGRAVTESPHGVPKDFTLGFFNYPELFGEENFF
jgi:hypothetical protein